MARQADHPSDLTNRELRAQVMRLENTIFAGTSSHRDVVVLIDCERELLRRERERFRLELQKQLLATRGDEDDLLRL